MIIKIQRDSVCMSDDIDAPHELELEFCNSSKISDIINKIYEEKYLPENCKWILVDSNENELVACYNKNNIFYSNSDITVEQLCSRHNLIRFKYVYNRISYISIEEEKYVNSLKYKLNNICSYMFLIILLLLFICMFANAIYPLIK